MKSLRYSPLKSFVSHFALSVPVNWNEVFGRAAPLDIEIGFGTGEYLVRLASRHPDRNFVGIEENVERIHKTMRKINQAGLDNVRIMHIDARLAFERFFPPESITQIHCLFPCPWPNKNQVKHRLFSKKFLRTLNNRLVPSGKIHLVTDYAAYAAWVKRQAAGTGFEVKAQTIAPRFDTKFERKWREAGQEKFYDFEFKKNEHVKSRTGREVPLKVYFFERFDPDRFQFSDSTEAPAVIFKEYFFDEKRRHGMVHLVAADEHLNQHLWIKILKTEHKGWCIAIADGSLVIPTPGAAKALEMVYQCAARPSHT